MKRFRGTWPGNTFRSTGERQARDKMWKRMHDDARDGSRFRNPRGNGWGLTGQARAGAIARTNRLHSLTVRGGIKHTCCARIDSENQQSASKSRRRLRTERSVRNEKGATMGGDQHMRILKHSRIRRKPHAANAVLPLSVENAVLVPIGLTVTLQIYTCATLAKLLKL